MVGRICIVLTIAAFLHGCGDEITAPAPMPEPEPMPAPKPTASAPALDAGL